MPSERHDRWGRLLWLIVTVAVVGLDQWTKGLASAQLEYGRPVPILPVLNFTLQYNTGAAFSFLSGESGWQQWFFSAVASVVSVVLILWLSRLRRNQWLLALSLALILGGALGNLLDRLSLGYVVDFISVHYAGSYFPAFNVADSAISVGAALMILDTILQGRNEEQEG
ncbi:MAG: signal peptidase II [Gammaproteobacteria bacterium]|nr:signal peptidase II [Gammaproteobacteria bacterium]